MMGNRDVLKVQGSFNTANTISSLSEKPFDYQLVLGAIPEKKKSNLVYFMDFIIVLFILHSR